MDSVLSLSISLAMASVLCWFGYYAGEGPHVLAWMAATCMVMAGFGFGVYLGRRDRR